jgi:hypothetical protein
VVEGLIGGKSRGYGDWHRFTPMELFWLVVLARALRLHAPLDRAISTSEPFRCHA